MRICCWLILASALVRAEVSSTLHGTVFDPSGAVVPAAVVRVIGNGQQSLTAVTDSAGRYAIRRLAPGAYRLEAEAAGLAPFSSDELAIAAGASARMDLVLGIAAVRQEVTVSTPFEPQVALDIRDVRESPAKDVGEALAGVEGLWKVRKGGIANDVVLRGFQRDNLTVLVDGARIHGACPGRMDPAASHVDFAEVEYVEVTRGAFDIVNQGSLGGAVRIIGKAPEPGLRFTPSLSAGSFGFYNPSLVASLTRPRVFALAGYSYRRGGPLVDGAGRAMTDYANYREPQRNGQAFSAGTGWFRAGGSPAESQRLAFGYTRQHAGRTLFPYLQMDAVYDDADRAHLSWQAQRMGRLEHLRVQGYFTRVRHWMTDEWRTTSTGAPRPFAMATFAETRTIGGRVDGEFSSFTAGFEGYRRNWDAVNTLRMAGVYTGQASVPGVWMTTGGAYAQFRKMLLDRLQIVAGARFDAASSEATDPAANTDLYYAYHGTRARRRGDAHPSGSVWLSYALGNGLELFAGAGRTIRFPDPQERFFALQRMGTDWVGNPALRSTRNTETDLGLTFHRRRLTIRPTLFHSRLHDFVLVLNQPNSIAVPSVMNPAARSYGNVEATIYGGELEWSFAVSRTLLLKGGLSYARGAWRKGDLPEMPPSRSHTALRYSGKLFFAEAEGVAVNAQKRVAPALLETPTPGYGLLNIKVGVHTGKLRFAAGVDNLFDRFYYEHYSFQRDPFRTGARVPEPGRSLFLTVAFR